MVAQPGHLPTSLILSLLVAAARPYQPHPTSCSLTPKDLLAFPRLPGGLQEQLESSQLAIAGAAGKRGQIEVIGSNFILAEENGERGSWWGLAYSSVMGKGEPLRHLLAVLGKPPGGCRALGGGKGSQTVLTVWEQGQKARRSLLEGS